MAKTKSGKPGGKGRPTPKRSEAQGKRRTAVGPAPTNRKEAAKKMRAESAARRAEMRVALRTGDERNYPPMAAGPERALVRDAIDARRSIAWLALPGWALGLALAFIPSDATKSLSNAVFGLLIGLVIADSFNASRAVGKALKQRFPNGTKERRGTLIRYAIAHNTAMRRMRTPRPRVQPGDPLP